MSTEKIGGIATALTSIAHGGDHAGTTQYLRRERVVQGDGTVVEIPIISGNAFRGVLRNHIATDLWRLLGEPELSLQAFHTLWSGGTLAKAGAGNVWLIRDVKRLHELIPHLAVIGCAAQGRIIAGRLMVGKLIPVCKETAHIVGATEEVPSIWDVVQIEEFSRMDDGKQPIKTESVEPSPELLADDKPEQAHQMRYGTETLASGTCFTWWIALNDPSPIEKAVLARGLDAWEETGAALGGRSATGHGKLQLQDQDGKPQPWADWREDDLLVSHVEAEKDRIIELLGSIR